MFIGQIVDNKRRYKKLLLLADEQENMIDRYIDRGRMFALFDVGLKTICVVTDEENGICELKNIATVHGYRGRGYGKRMIEHICRLYSPYFCSLMVGTGDSPLTVPFTDNYDHPIVECGKLLVDMVYLKKNLRRYVR